jgi:hypothetical protein
MARAQDSSTLRARWQVGKPTAIFDQASHSRMLQIHEIIMQGIDAALRKRSYPSVESGQRATMPLRPSSTSAMSARPAAGCGRMRRWGQFCTLSSQAPSRETRQALGALNRSAIGTQSLPIHRASEVRYLT